MFSSPVRRRALYVLLAVVLISGFTFVFAPTGSEALPANEVETLYFSDAAHTNLVGERLLLCSGHLYKWGVVTSFKTIYSTPC